MPDSTQVLTGPSESPQAQAHATSEKWREPFTPVDPAVKAAVQEPDVIPSVPDEGESAADSETAKTENEDKGEKSKKPGIQKRIGDLTREKYELKAKFEAAEAERQRLADELAGRSKPKVEEPTGKPTPDKFATYEEFTEALTDWKLEQKEKAKAESDAKASEESRMKETFDTYNQNVEKFTAENPDFEEVVGNSKVSVPDAVRVAIVDSGDPAIAYYLAKNPEVCEKLSKMTQARAVLEVGKIIAKLDTTEKSPEKPSSPEKKAVSRAPEPIAPVAGGSTKSAVPLDELPYREYKKARER